MGAKDIYAKGIFLSEAVETVDLSKIDNLAFVVLRLADGYNAQLSTILDKKFVTFYEQAAALKIPVFPWMRIYPRMWADTGWQIDDYNRWAERKSDISSNEDFALAIMDRFLAPRTWWHGLIYSVYTGAYNPAANTYDVSSAWAQAVSERVRNLFNKYYAKMTAAADAPTRLIWPEYPADLIANQRWDGGILDTWVKDIDLSIWLSAGFPVQTVTGRLDLNALPWPEDLNIPTYSKQTRTNSLWRAANTTVLWDGAKNANGGPCAVPIYLMYASKTGLYNRFQIPNTPVNPGGGGGDNGGGTADPVDVSGLAAAVDRNTEQVKRLADAVEKIAGVFK